MQLIQKKLIAMMMMIVDDRLADQDVTDLTVVVERVSRNDGIILKRFPFKVFKIAGVI